MRITYYTDAGPLRPENQDALLVGDDIFLHTPTPYALTIPHAGLAAVADGMGGVPGGDVAALTLLRRLISAPLPLTQDSLISLCTRAREDMRACAHENASLSRMGAVMAGVAWDTHRVTLFNCGDCRVYYSSPDHLVRLTRDHSTVQQLYDQHLIDDEGQRLHPKRHILTSAISADNIPQQLFYREFALSLLGRLFVCSDGVWEALPATSLRTLLAEPDPFTCATQLVRALEAARATDNISFLLLDADTSPTDHPVLLA